MNHIAILDFGSQYTHLIARRIRELNVLAKIYPSNTRHEELSNDSVLGIVVSGGPQSVYDVDSVKIDPKILELKKPVLGLCYGHQLITSILGGEVKPGKVKEYGKAELNTTVETHGNASKSSRQNNFYNSHSSSRQLCPKNSSKYLDTLQNFLNKSDVNLNATCKSYFVANPKNDSTSKNSNASKNDNAFKNAKNTSILNNVSSKTIVWMSHGDSVARMPAGFNKIAATNDCPIAGMADEKRQIYGLQFHPEVHHTVEGTKMIENFVFNICQAEKNWRIENIVDDLIQKIVETHSNVAVPKNVFILVSGGVDSSVAFALLTKALGKERVIGLYIDTGFMRLNESIEIQENFKKAGFDNIQTYDASQDFFASLKNKYDPEEKRQIIGQVFLDAKDEVFAKLKLNTKEWLLGQGTIYPDTIESGTTEHADIIKTHHNRIDAIAKMVEQGLVIEPLVDFYKDEVREIGRLLGLSSELVERHPFPGPGLAIRCLCSQKSKVKSQKLQVKSQKLKINYSVLPIKSVGVQGDNRTYAHPLVVWGEVDWNRLDIISREAVNSNSDINRVLLLLNPQKEENLFSLPAADYFLTKKRIDLLRRIDAIVMAQIRDAGLYDEIWQFPIVLVPVGREINGKFRESIVLRPIVSRDAMTADFARIAPKILDKITEHIIDTGEISYVFYDVTNKPPGTIEWE